MKGTKKLLAMLLSAVLLLALLPSSASAASGDVNTFTPVSLKRTGDTTAVLTYSATAETATNAASWLVLYDGSTPTNDNVLAGTDFTPADTGDTQTESITVTSGETDAVLWYTIGGSGAAKTTTPLSLSIPDYLAAPSMTAPTGMNRTAAAAKVTFTSSGVAGKLYYVVDKDTSSSTYSAATAIKEAATSTTTIDLTDVTTAGSFTATIPDATADYDIYWAYEDAGVSVNATLTAGTAITVNAFTAVVNVTEKTVARTATSATVTWMSNADATLYYLPYDSTLGTPAPAGIVAANKTVAITASAGTGDFVVEDLLATEDKIAVAYVVGTSPAKAADSGSSITISSFTATNDVTSLSDRSETGATMDVTANAAATLWYLPMKTGTGTAPTTLAGLKAATGAKSVPVTSETTELPLTGLTGQDKLYFAFEGTGVPSTVKNVTIPVFTFDVTIGTVLRNTPTTAAWSWDANGTATLYWLVDAKPTLANAPVTADGLKNKSSVNKVSMTSVAEAVNVAIPNLTAGTLYNLYYAIEVDGEFINLSGETNNALADSNKLATINIGAGTFYTVAIVDGGTNASGVGDYAENAKITINAGTRSGYTFDGWKITQGTIALADAKLATTTFTMLSTNVILTATWKGGGSTGGGGGTYTPDYDYDYDWTAADGDDPVPPPASVPSIPSFNAPPAAAPSTDSYRIVARTLNVRSGAGTSFAKVGTLSANAVVSVVGYSTDGLWGQLSTGGWISLAYAASVNSIVDVGDYIVSATTLNVRSGPGTSSPKIGSLKNGALVMVNSVTNGWAQIEYNGGIGYVSSVYLR